MKALLKKPTVKASPPPPVSPPTPALAIETVAVSESCLGSRWEAADIDRLARIIAIIAIGQAAHAARIITALLPAAPLINVEALRSAAKRRLVVTGDTDEQKHARRYHRDGLIFEAISWAAAQQSAAGKALLRDPHLSSTTQGLDGLMIELDDTGTIITLATIFEDKCSENPRDKFRDEIMSAFLDHHDNKRAPELLAAAASLLEKTGLDGSAAINAAARVLDKACRAYRASVAITAADDNPKRRKALFKDYDELKGIDARRRIAGTLVTADDLRAWFDALAANAVAYIDTLDLEDI